MKLRLNFILLLAAILFSSPVSADNPTRIIKGASVPDRTPARYVMDCIVNAPYTPEFQVLDTESAFGRYAPMSKEEKILKLLGYEQ